MTLMEVTHVIAPGYVQTSEVAELGETVAAFLLRTDWDFQLPTICVVNGQPLMRAEWDEYVITEDTQLAFVSRPHGSSGGNSVGKQILGIVALIALVAFAYWAAPALLGSLASTTLVGSLTLGQVVTGAIVMGGSLLISSLLKPKPGGQTDPKREEGPAAEQIYSLTATGNTGRLLGPLPVLYGRLKTFPDYATTPWSEYIGTDEYLNIVLVLSVGYIYLEKIYVDDSELWDRNTGYSGTFTDVQVAHYDAGADITLFPLNVYLSPDVSALELPDPAVTPWIGPFITNNAGTVCTDIGIDLAMPQGLFSVESVTGKFLIADVSIVVEYQPINGAGTPTGPYVSLFSKTYSLLTRTPQRFTEKVAVTPSRYQVRMHRTNKPNLLTPKTYASTGAGSPSGGGGSVSGAAEEQQHQDSLVWLGMRAFLQGPTSFDLVTTLAIRMKATSQLSQQSAKKFGVLMTRAIMQTAEGDVGQTQNPVWAFYDAATNQEYGARRSPAKMDLTTIAAAAAEATARGDEFNYLFTTIATVPAAFDKCLAPARLKHRWAGDVLTVVRDEWKPVPQMLLTDAQIVKGSLAVDYVFNDEEVADSVIIEYLDDSIWGPAEVQYPPNVTDGFQSVFPARIRLDGITDRDHATREAAFYYLQAYYRRIFITLETEHDGRILSLGAAVRIQSELPQTWGQTGDIVAVNTHTLTLEPAPTWDVGQNYINIRTRVGGSWGPCKVSEGVEPYLAVLDDADVAATEAALGVTLIQALDRTEDSEIPVFDLGIADKLSKRCIVLSGKPSGDKVQLNLVVDRQEVHSTDLSDVPVIPSTPPTQPVKTPFILGLLGNFRQGVAEAVIEASWWGSRAATSYTADVSYDLGVTWTHVYDGVNNSFSAVVTATALKLRVAGVGAVHGPYAIISLGAPAIVIAPGAVDVTSFTEGLRDQVTNEFNRTMAKIREWQQLIASVAVEQEAANWIDKFNTKKIAHLNKTVLQGEIATLSTSITAQFGDAFAQIETNQIAIADLDGAFASYQTAVDVRFGLNEGLIETNQVAIADVDGAFSSFKITTEAKIGGVTGAAVNAVVTNFISTAIFSAVAHGYIAGTAVMVNGYSSIYYVLAGLTADLFTLGLTTSGPVLGSSTFPDGPYVLHEYTPGTIEANVTTNTTAIATHTKSIASLDATVEARMGAVGEGKVFTVTIDGSGARFTSAGHGLSVGNRVLLDTTGTLYTGLPLLTDLFVIALDLNANQFRLSLTSGGAAIVPTGSQSGIHTFYPITTGSIQASVTTNSTAIVTIQGKLLATWQVTLNANGYISGIQAFNDGTTSAFIISADLFQIAWPSVTGGTPQPVFQVATVAGVSKLAFRGDMLSDGLITARNLTTGSAVITGSAQIGDLVVGAINIADAAVTVPAAASRTDNIVGVGFGTFIDNTLTCSLSITGINLKPMTVFTLCKYGTIYGVSGEQEGVLKLNSTDVDTAGGGLGATTVLMYTTTITADGTSQPFAAALSWRGNVANTLTQRSMFMIGAKR